MVLEHTNLVAATADQTPIWKVSGRITNNSAEYLHKLRVQIYFKTRGTGAVQDRVNLDLDTNVAPHNENSFSTQFAMRPPPRGWDMFSEILEARTGPH
jgi:hypothetical protein